MDLGLRGRVALVGAASKGLGRAVARELAMEGARVVICARSGDTLEEAARAIGAESGNEVHPVVADLSQLDGVRRVADEALHRFGQVDVLVNNAGGPPSGPFEKHDWSAWEGAVALTLRSAVELTRAVLPGMRERRWGRIVNITSIAVKQPVDGLMLSNSLRAAVTGWARTLANEVAEQGITVNNVLPGYTRTERVEELNRARAEAESISIDEVEKRIEKQIPMRRMATADEFAGIVTFLASERARYITAQSIAVDGGWIRSIV